MQVRWQAFCLRSAPSPRSVPCSLPRPARSAPAAPDTGLRPPPQGSPPRCLQRPWQSAPPGSCPPALPPCAACRSRTAYNQECPCPRCPPPLSPQYGCAWCRSPPACIPFPKVLRRCTAACSLPCCPAGRRWSCRRSAFPAASPAVYPPALLPAAPSSFSGSPSRSRCSPQGSLRPLAPQPPPLPQCLLPCPRHAAQILPPGCRPCTRSDTAAPCRSPAGCTPSPAAARPCTLPSSPSPRPRCGSCRSGHSWCMRRRPRPPWALWHWSPAGRSWCSPASSAASGPPVHGAACPRPSTGSTCQSRPALRHWLPVPAASGCCSRPRSSSPVRSPPAGRSSPGCRSPCPARCPAPRPPASCCPAFPTAVCRRPSSGYPCCPAAAAPGSARGFPLPSAPRYRSGSAPYGCLPCLPRSAFSGSFPPTGSSALW